MTALKTVTLLLIIVSVASARVLVSEGMKQLNLSGISDRCRLSLLNVQNVECIRNWLQIVHNSGQAVNIEKTRQDLSAALPPYCSSSCGTEVENAAKNITASCTETKEDFAVVKLAQAVSVDRTIACRQISNQYCALTELDLFKTSGINYDVVENFLEGFSTANITDYSKIEIEKLPKAVVCNDCVRAYIDIGSKVAIGEKRDCARGRYYDKIMSYCGNNNSSVPHSSAPTYPNTDGKTGKNSSSPAYPSTGGTTGTATVSSNALQSSNFVGAVGGAIAAAALAFA